MLRRKTDRYDFSNPDCRVEHRLRGLLEASDAGFFSVDEFSLLLGLIFLGVELAGQSSQALGGYVVRLDVVVSI